MKKYVLIITVLLTGLSAFAQIPINIDHTIDPKYRGWNIIINKVAYGVGYDCLDAFIDLHKQLTKEEGAMVAEVEVAKVEMDGIEKNGSSYSSHEQLWEKRLKDGQHYFQLATLIAGVAVDVVNCTSAYKSYTKAMEEKMKECPEAGLLWANTLQRIKRDIDHANGLAAGLIAGSLLSRSTSAEKYKLLNEIKSIILNIRSIISSGERNVAAVGLKVNFEAKPSVDPARAGYNEWSEFNNNWF